MLEKIKDHLGLFGPIYFVVIVLSSWIGIAQFENYYLITLYPLYVTVLLTGVGLLLHQEREINQIPRYALELEVRVFPKIIILAYIILIIIWFLNIIAWEILLIPFLLNIILILRYIMVNKALDNLNKNTKQRKK